MNRSTETRSKESLPYSGYHQSWTGQGDDELTRVGPNTPCGEYLRRFWHPVAMTSDLGERPKLIRILGEDLVLFRDKGERVGLVHRRCPHRRASLEFGVTEERGIRCCYHGWLFDVDGTTLEAPGQPAQVEKQICENVTLGAYPVKEFKGLIFAYMGPPGLKPVFPVYDTFDLPGQTLVPYTAPFHCNWLQVLDAIVDPIHTAFLHSRISREQFSEGFGEIGKMKFYKRRTTFLGTAARRVGDNVWVRTNELVLPNFTQAGAAFSADGTRQLYYSRTSFVRWVVPIDDEETLCFAWAVFGERADPDEYNTPEGPELIEQGEVFDRSYEEKQRCPADAEATEGMGPITEHNKEHLVASDQGIVMYRRRLRSLIRDLQDGKEPAHATDDWQDGPIPTFGGDTVVQKPKNGGDDAVTLRNIGRAVMEVQFEAEGLPETDRVAKVVACLKQIETDEMLYGETTRSD
ncbi:aromatic ring-hydroxylating dioxygenase subunit alpha [Pelagibius sp. Alg239-R121]|uniref:aromatic ring-hydroxylating dioxygenase subunit alpha n=1 Tax=Pelagibius sp. Alg239-R121 TaxID=2993448 RepID=UPI0024A66004|nr:aromatic ring-hydroxylating dioxygenase subunit alpha [Pelagibius sp. Alg239-R121]